MPRDQRDIAVAQRRDETQSILDRVQNAKGSEVAVIVRIPAGGAPVSSEVGGDDMKLYRGERQHDLSPRIGELRKAMEQQHQRAPLGLKAGLQHVDPQAVDIGCEAGADAGSERGGFQRRQIGHARLLSDGSIDKPNAKRRE